MSESNIRTYGAKLAAQGYPVVAIAPGQKRPIGLNWQHSPLSQGQCEQYPTPEAGVGVLCGYGAKPLIGIDADIEGDPELAAAVKDRWQKLSGACLANPVRVGKPPKFLIVARTQTALRKITTAWYEKDGRRIRIEILGKGQQFVAYHTHPETKKPYDWSDSVFDSNLYDLSVDELEFIDTDTLRLLLDAFEKEALAAGYIKSGVGSTEAGNATFDDMMPATLPLGLTAQKAEELLNESGIDPQDYDTWLHAGMALHHEFSGSREGRDIWNRWSSKAANYKGAADIEAKWESFGKGAGSKITMRWVQAKWRENVVSTPAPLTETGLAHKFFALYGNRLRWIESESRWVWFNGYRWEDYAEIQVQGRIQTMITSGLHKELRDLQQAGGSDEDVKVLREFIFRCENRLSRCVSFVYTNVKRHPALFACSDDFDKTTHYFNVANGTLDLQTCSFVPSSPELMLRRTAKVSYDKDAQCPRWRRAVLEIMDGDETRAAYLQRLVGCAMLGNPAEELMAFFVGFGCNGKSLFINIMKDVFGGYFQAVPSSLLVSTGRRRTVGAESASPVLLSLKGSRFAACCETPTGASLEESLVKQLTGRDAVAARGMYAKEVTVFNPTWVLFMATNHMPVIRGTDKGIWRRVRIVKFGVDFDTSTKYVKDVRLEQKLKGDELPGILNWCLEGVKAYNENGLQTPGSVMSDVEGVRENFDILNDWIGECCTLETGARLPASDAWRSWQVYARNSGDLKFADTQRFFTRQLSERFPMKKTNGRNVFFNLRLKSAEEMDERPLADEELDALL